MFISGSSELRFCCQGLEESVVDQGLKQGHNPMLNTWRKRMRGNQRETGVINVSFFCVFQQKHGYLFNEKEKQNYRLSHQI